MIVHSETPFPDLELGLVAWAQGLYPDALVWDELPARYGDNLPVIVIEDEGGMSDGLTLFSTVNVSVFARDDNGRSGREIAREIATNLCSRMGVYPRHFGGVVVDSVEVADWPTRSKSQEPDENTTCFSGELTVSLRRK